ncbi:MAG TPA: fibrobacter succinogenes major paralogous domain-containing protein [Chitinophagaceae bacterium]|jgi:uncharacterized protein (TIGR02145 family)|nr:fibrobacter succinogenes major paralogous domain-containing protein [Chitinophagaceae bacterium]MBP9739475.1 fibrobacter succinogenes major paralogous domain-containing protein [Chitinophagaceae bacterium]HPH24644.1 fibrobacter succinogenes major paralogous domain-containing protein [Chitinophagaceae bacterium]
MNNKYLFLLSLFMGLNTICSSQAIPTLKISKQTWMLTNLDAIVFNNGDTIQQAKTFVEWKDAALTGKPAWCYYMNSEDSGKIYGKLYNWFAVNDKRGLAPKGFHIPSVDEWTILIEATGGEKQGGAKLKSKQFWMEDCGGKNQTGFTALPAGFRLCDGSYYSIGLNTNFWTSTSGDRDLDYAYSVDVDCGAKIIFSYNKKCLGLSVRCIQN